MQVFDPYPRWRKPKASDEPDEWADGTSAVRMRASRPLTPEQQARIAAVLARVREVPRNSLVQKLTRHRRVYARGYVLAHSLDIGPASLSEFHGLSINQARKALRKGGEILREYFTEEELRGLLECWGSPRPP